MTETTTEFIPAATVEEVPPGTSKVITIEGRRIALFNVNSTFYAIEVVACPKHGSRFHIPTGRVLSLPAVVPLNTYQVKVEAGQVLVLPVPHRGRGMPHKA